MIRTGLVSITFRKLQFPQIVEMVRAAGLASIEWGGDVHVPHGDRRRAADVRRRMDDAGLFTSAYGSYYRVGCEPEDGLRFESVLDTALALGAPTVRVWAGGVCSADATPSLWAHVINESRRIAALAQAAGLAIAYEFHADTLGDHPASTARLLNDVARQNVSTFWQPPNGVDFETSAAGLQSLLPHLSNVHVFHWWPTNRDRHPLAAGLDRWTRYLERIRGSGRPHVCSIEFVRDDDPTAFAEDARVLRRLCGELP